MKYFTPTRFLQLGNLTNERAFLAAQEEWELAVSGYKRHLQRIQDKLPVGMRRLVASVYLHDAHVLAISLGSRNRFSITLHPESDPARLVIISYSLLEPPLVEPGALPPEVQAEPMAWLYDELDIVGTRSNGRGREALSFTHDILFSNGWAVRLRFRGATVTRPAAIVPLGTKEGGLSDPACRLA